jgi:hypothetical protein
LSAIARRKAAIKLNDHPARLLRAGIVLSVTVLLGGCEDRPGGQRRPTQPAGAAEQRVPAEPAGPKATIERLVTLRAAGDLAAMRDLIVPQRAAELVVTLTAVDEFLAANRRLCEIVRREIGSGLAASIDQRRYAYFLDVFSPHVRVLDETLAGDRASVAYLVNEQLPARRTELVRIGGRWRYDPGAGDYEQLAAAFRRMAYGLRQTIAELESGDLAAADIRRQPELLLDDIRMRLLPGVKMLPQAPEDP